MFDQSVEYLFVEETMVRLLRTVVLMLIVSSMFVLPAIAAKVNTPAPDFTLKDLDGRTVSLKALKGKVVFLNFWATNCPPCIAEIPDLNSLSREYKNSGLVVLGVSIDPSEKPVREMVKKLKMEYPVMMDSSRDVYFDTYGLFGLPVTVLIDRNGIIREKIVGQFDWLAPPARAKILELLKGK
jgi:peroxiredoxin